MGQAAASAFLAVSAVVPVLAAAACAMTAWRKAGREPTAWALIALSCLTWGLWTAAATVLQVAGTSLPAYLSDARFGLVMLPAVFGLTLLASAPAAATARLRALLDGAVVASSLLFLGWGTILGAAYRDVRLSLDLRVLGLTHPLADMVLLSAVIFLLYRAWRARRLSWLSLSLGVLIIAITDGGLTWMQLRSIDTVLGIALECGWLAGFALIGLSAVFEKRNQAMTSIVRLPIAAAAFLNVPPVAVGLMAGFKELTTGGLEPFLFWNAMVVVMLVLTREMITVIENRTLIRTMESRIAARTEELRKSEAKYKTLIQTSPDAIIITDEQGKITFQGPGVERVLGRAPDSELGRSWFELIHPDDQPRLQSIIEKTRQTAGSRITTEARISHADDGWRQAEVTITNLLEEPTVPGLVINLRDITERKALDEQLAHHALHDPLTGLVNRAVFRDRLHQSVIRAARRSQQPAVVLVDLDDFRHVNEGHGLPGGDALLAAVAERLRRCVRAGDTVARFSGDAFVILLEDTANDDSPALVAQRVLAELDTITVADQPIKLSASIGIASLVPGGQNPDDLLRNADTAMSEAKAAGKGRIAVYDRTMAAVPATQLELQADLQRAIERKEFIIHYQPIVRLKDGRASAVEALVRWVHPWRGILPPGDFIFAADKTGAIVSLGRWIMLTAAKQVRNWQEDLQLPTLGLAVNLSVRQLTDEGLVNDVKAVLEETGLEPTLLMLELMESALMEDLQQSIATLQQLKDLGVNLAIDDFRTGFSSHSYLLQLPIDTLKIDRSFIANLGKQRETSQVQSMLSLGETLKLEMIAEGIEDMHQANALLGMGCQLGQGFYFAKPLAGPQMFDYLERQCRENKAA